ncbi:uncharacterized protein LAESUDRAFT_578341 [Laetiporus sulphureus 93-53]|uniref:C2H2-type domain-containing protein n=1 Tax=Laetiporus sulphureus 93-53 TaxID=1314785 RepID=A0A165B0D0_9APHY|nr:uncharacterized protein LAESUDRAFT_578341 [Laetiporus sulphureus 93-53]KZS99991.1 hypothetical protein LAESUDRAFT_578341 [Laetiporus sulphureus 93-53]
MSQQVCQWDGCGILLDDTIATGCTRHLKQFHLQPLGPAMTGRCQWIVRRPDPPPGVPLQLHHTVCNRKIKYANFGKHVAFVHVRSTSPICLVCGTCFSRPDALRRHEHAGICPGPI